MKTCALLLIVVSFGLSGCAWLQPSQNEVADSAPVNPEFESSSVTAPLSKSEFIADDFMSVVLRIPQLIPGQTRFSSSLPKTRYGEILMERMRQAGFAIVLGPAPDIRPLDYRIELPAEDGQNLHTFFLSVGDVHLKRSYEIVDDRIAPASPMLMAGVDASTLRPVTNSEPNAPVAEELPVGSTEVVAQPSDVKVPQLNQLISADEGWNPLLPNMYESLTSVYDPMFEDATVKYEQVSTQVLVFPNDSLVLGNLNKNYLFDLANRFLPSTDVVRVIGCSHGKTQLLDGNQKLARGRAVRVREELMLAGIDGAAILHEACWANKHFDEVMPRRGVVVMHLREDTSERS